MREHLWLPIALVALATIAGTGGCTIDGTWTYTSTGPTGCHDKLVWSVDSTGHLGCFSSNDGWREATGQLDGNNLTFHFGDKSCVGAGKVEAVKWGTVNANCTFITMDDPRPQCAASACDYRRLGPDEPPCPAPPSPPSPSPPHPVPPPSPGPPGFDCAWRKSAYRFGATLLPRLGAFPLLHAALELGSRCVNESADPGHRPPVVRASPSASLPPSPQPLPPDALYVAPEEGSDRNPGTEASPLATIAHALLAVHPGGTIVLRGGTHWLADTLNVSAATPDLTLRAFPNELPIVSGGTLLATNWSRRGGPASKIYVTRVSDQNVSNIVGLLLNGSRATRARYPNRPGGVESQAAGYAGAVVPGDQAVYTPSTLAQRYGNATLYTDTNPGHYRNDTAKDWFQQYMIGIGGACTNFDPPVSYWCSALPRGGPSRRGYPYSVPSGITPQPGALPHAPYADASEAIVTVWRHARWATWMFDLESYDPVTNNFTFRDGGFQGARGGDGGDFYIEGVFEELDDHLEFFFNKTTRELFLYFDDPTSTAPPLAQLSSLECVAPRLQTLLSASGSRWSPVRGLTVEGISFTGTAITYMAPHAAPSGGDFALTKHAAVVLENTESATVAGCTFERVEGNGVVIYGYNRNSTIRDSDFHYPGGSGIVLWGVTNETEGDGHPEAGWDGTDGNHPRYTALTGNVIHDVALYEKQSGFIVSAKATLSTIRNNVMWGAPRTGVNFNDGFGGGDDFSYNLIFSVCRESTDAGPINTWDRAPYLTDVLTGEPSLRMAPRTMHHNMVVSNNNGTTQVSAFDTDDGSAYQHIYSNFVVMGGYGMKSDCGGHSNVHRNNVYAWVNTVINMVFFEDADDVLDADANRMENNTVVITTNDVGQPICNGTGMSLLRNNSYYTPSGMISECRMSLANWQGRGNDLLSTVAATPSVAVVMAWGEAVLAADNGPHVEQHTHTRT